MSYSHAVTIRRFAELLAERVDVGWLTESALRFTFACALMDVEPFHHYSIDFECALPFHTGSRLDLVATELGHDHSVVAEFKYHHERLYSVLPCIALAGKLYRDLFRLAFTEAWWSCAAYLVYLTDEIMADYLCDPQFGCASLWQLAPDDQLRIGPDSLAGRSKTFRKAIGDFAHYPATVTCVHRDVFTTGHATRELRVFQVTHEPDEIYDQYWTWATEILGIAPSLLKG